MKDRSHQAREQYRAQRAERRAKQRLENVVRAKKMHAVRLSVIHEESSAFRTSAPSNVPPVNVGCSGWFYWHWKGLFYPESIPTNRWFEHYASKFNTVELNAPFYSWPTMGTVNTWLRQAARRRFVYTVKVSELITHTKRFVGTKTLIRDFGYIADLLGRRMGCFLFQLPPSFHYTAGALRRIVDQLDPIRRNVVEFRHPSWWNEAVFKAFREAGIIFCSCSGPRLPDQLVKTASDIYVRFHGTRNWYRHDYTDVELGEWSQRMRDSGATRMWAYFNNDRGGYALRNALRLETSLKRKPRAYQLRDD